MSRYSSKEVENTLAKYMSLPQGTRIQAEYIWIGGNGNLRSKCKTLSRLPKSLKDLPEWNYDGSSTNQAPGHNSEVWIKPCKMVPDPFRGGNNILVLCDTYDPENANKGLPMKPLPSNKRYNANIVFEKKEISDEHPWFGIEQEYTMFESDGITPLGWPKNGYPKPQGPYYCSAGTNRAIGRAIVEAHYRCCLYAGLDISGVNAEVMPGQWEYQIGPCEGIDSGDQLWISRYLLERVAEDFGVVISLSPKPVQGDWNGAGCHTNFSTTSMRQDGGFKKIIEACEKLKTKHLEHMELYGKNNRLRLTGLHETAPYEKFSYGVADRGSSIRIPRFTQINGKGYLEDRRPAANMDPYLVTSKLVKTVILDKIKVSIPINLESSKTKNEKHEKEEELVENIE